MFRRSLLVAATALLPWVARADVEVLSQDRGVSVDIDVVEQTYSSCIPLITPSCLPDSTTSQNFADAETAPDALPFVATANAPAFPGSLASQDSEIGASTIRGSGSHAATAGYSNTGGFPITFHSEYHDVESHMRVDFELGAALPYTLVGSVATGGAIFSSSSAWIRLSGPGGIVAELQVDSDPNCTDPSCFDVGPLPLAASGTLDPGAYTLEAVAQGSAGGVHSTSGSFGTGVDGAFDVELSLGEPSAVPSLGTPGLALLALLLVGGAGLTARGSGSSLPGAHVRRRA
jgi:hypothetical protein